MPKNSTTGEWKSKCWTSFRRPLLHPKAISKRWNIWRKRVRPGQNADFQFQLGNVYLGLDRLRTRSGFRQSLEIDRFHPDSLMGLCRTYLKLGSFEKAADFGRQAIGLKFYFPVAHYFLAQARQELGDVDGAVSSLNLALKQNPNFLETHELLADIHRGVDDELAREHDVAASDLKKGLAEYDNSHMPIEIQPVEELDFSKILPDFALQNNAKFLPSHNQNRLLKGVWNRFQRTRGTSSSLPVYQDRELP